MKAKFLSTTLICGLSVSTMWFSPPLYSYNYESHDKLSRKIISESNLKQSLSLMGLHTLKDELTLYNNDERFADVTKSVTEWLLYGTEQEDAILSSNLARFRTSINSTSYEELNQNIHFTRMKRWNLRPSFPVNILIQTFLYLSLRRIS